MEKNRSDASFGKIIKYIGWVGSLIALIYSVMAYIDIASDVSTKAYAFFVWIEGGFFICIALVIVWIGNRIEKKR